MLLLIAAPAGLTLLVLIDSFTTRYLVNALREPSELFGQAAIDVVRRADRVEVFRVEPLDPRSTSQPGLRKYLQQPFAGGTVIAGPVLPAAEWIKRLRQLLLASRSYIWDVHKACIPTPGVAVRFHRGNETAELLLCFECDMVSLSVLREHGYDRWANSDPMRSELLRLAREVFPNDSVLNESN